MADNEKKPLNVDPESMQKDEFSEEMHLDDARRVKVLSPGMLVFKRFVRNSLAVVGFVILLFMFLFAFAGPFFSPYKQTQVFKGMDTMSKEYAGAIRNTELRYVIAEGQSFDSADRSAFLLALGKNEAVFISKDITYHYVEEGEGVYRIMQADPVATLMVGLMRYNTGEEVPAGFEAAYQAADDQGLINFEWEGTEYLISKKKKEVHISTEHDVALAMLSVFDAYKEEDVDTTASFGFRLATSRAIAQNLTGFSLGNENFTIEYNASGATVYDSSGNPFAEISDIIVNPLDQSLFLSVEFKSAIRESINDRQTEFVFTHENGDTIEYSIVRVNNTYSIRKDTSTEMIRMFEAPSAAHPLGLDNNGMDMMTRLMFGGRISLMVGFVVILIEVSIGVTIGGISGFFKGWLDTFLMRFVDLFNSIPFYPVVLIFGSVMDTMQVDPIQRIFLLMLILGILSWTGYARLVRGQILTLREQEFMVATEATGIRTSRRIFRHLIPNVMPLLIVNATAELGGIIITEATLGFLGLGVKYPLASWGSIINVASDAFVMTNYWFMWIPAGLLILLTVLGFNFVGDGLRDAYDPKMKR